MIGTKQDFTVRVLVVPISFGDRLGVTQERIPLQKPISRRQRSSRGCKSASLLNCSRTPHKTHASQSGYRPSTAIPKDRVNRGVLLVWKECRRAHLLRLATLRAAVTSTGVSSGKNNRRLASLTLSARCAAVRTLPRCSPLSRRPFTPCPPRAGGQGYGGHLLTTK